MTFLEILARLALLGMLMLPVASQTPPETQKPPLVELTGRVIGWDGQPIAGVAIRCEPVRGHRTSELLRNPQTVTDAEGRYRMQVQPTPPDSADPLFLFLGMKGLAAVSRNISWKRKDQAVAAGARAQDWAPPDEGEEDRTEGEAEAAAAPDATPAPAIQYEAETAMDDIVLAPGGRLSGRVRDEDGKPLAGVEVVARDLLEQGNALRSGRSFGFYTATTTDSSGIFLLPCALPVAATLSFKLDGYHRERVEPASTSTGVEVTMRPSGWIQGRVLDSEGRAIEQAYVSINYELQPTNGTVSSVRTGADGSFRMSVDHPGRWRVRATKRIKEQNLEARSEVFQGPKEHLELTFKPAEAKESAQRLPILVVAKATGKPVPMFKAAAVWEEYANQNTSYLDYRLRSNLRSAKPAKGGGGEVNGPGKHGTTVGAIRVIAPGLAPATVKDVEWKEPEGDQKPEPLKIELEPEASIRGKLVDESTGKPVVGAQVYARFRQDRSQGYYDDGSSLSAEAVKSDEDGSFHLRGLGEGAWEIIVVDSKRPRLPPKEVDLVAQEQKTDFLVTMPSGATVTGTLKGATISHGTRVFLSKLPKQTFGDSNSYYSHYSSSHAPSETTAVTSDGSFQIDGVALENHLLVIRFPSPPRLGGDLYLPLEPFRVRRDGIRREFDCSEDLPGKIHGRISFQHVDVPFDRLVVVARLVGEEGRQFFSPFDNRFPGPRSFVGPTGEYELRLGPGAYQLTVVDLATSLAIHNETKKVELATGGVATRDLSLELARIQLELKPAADVQECAQVERIEIRLLTKAMKEGGMNFAGNDNYDTGIGIRLARGQTKLDVILPPGEATFLARNQVAQLRVDDDRWNVAPLGRGELEIAVGPGAKTSCVIEIGAPPEIPDPDKKEKENADADDAGNAKIK